MFGERQDRMRDLENRYPVWEPLTLWQRLVSCAHEHASSPFVIFEDGMEYSYEETLRCVSDVASSLGELGVRRNDHVAVKLPNSRELVFLIFALSKLGAVLVSVNTGAGPYEFGYSVAHSDSSYVVCDAESRFEHVSDAAHLKNVVVVSGTDSRDSVSAACAYWKSLGVSAEPWEDLQTVSGASVRSKACEDGCASDSFAVSNIMYTSGSTGNPKGVPLSADKLFRTAFSNCLNRGFEQGRRIMVPLPLCHCFGFVEGLLSALFVGGSIVLCEGHFNAEHVLRLAQRTCCNDIFSVPVQAAKYIELLKREPMEFPCLHAMYCGGTTYESTLPSALRRAFGINDIVNGFGMTEMGGAVLQSCPGDDDETVAGYVGRMMPAGCAGSAKFGGSLAQYRVVADEQQGEDAAPGKLGHLWVKGATLMEGYYRDPEQNRRRYTPDGWFKTGDLGFFTPEGYLCFKGRAQDVYRINGENVSTQLVETVLEECPGVGKAAVVGVPDARHGAVGAAFVQLESDSKAAREGVERFAKHNLARYQEPARYFFLKEGDWPLTDTGKVQKFKLKKIAAERMGPAV